MIGQKLDLMFVVVELCTLLLQCKNKIFCYSHLLAARGKILELAQLFALPRSLLQNCSYAWNHAAKFYRWPFGRRSRGASRALFPDSVGCARQTAFPCWSLCLPFIRCFERRLDYFVLTLKTTLLFLWNSHVFALAVHEDRVDSARIASFFAQCRVRL